MHSSERMRVQRVKNRRKKTSINRLLLSWCTQNYTLFETIYWQCFLYRIHIYLSTGQNLSTVDAVVFFYYVTYVGTVCSSLAL